jgi:hypothetical protein
MNPYAKIHNGYMREMIGKDVNGIAKEPPVFGKHQ